MSRKKRWALLEHKGAPDDSKGIHFDLLLEDLDGCRAWRLPTMPSLDGPSLEIIALPTHRCEWLSIVEGEVSGGRGRVKRVLKGFFSGELPLNQVDAIHIELDSDEIKAHLEIKNMLCKLSSL